jgi:hypothetical protein
MDLVSLSPLRAGSFVWRRGDGGGACTVVVKATYDLAPEEARLAEQQEPIHDADEHWDDDPARSLYASSDLVPHKARADVVLVGRAFAPRDEPVASLLARLVVGTVDKAIEVHRNRSWSDAGRLVEGPLFTSMPLVYERAAGGSGTWNPVGVEADARPGPDGTARLPNLVPPGFKVTGRGARIPPIGFGPIAATWPNRLSRFGPHVSLARGPIQHLPDGLDAASFNGAPKDQQPSAIKADERIVLENLDPQHARLSTALPGVRPRVLIEGPAGSRELTMVADTLWIDTDRRIATLTWRGTFFLSGAERSEHLVVAAEGPTPDVARVDATHVESAEDESDVTLGPGRDKKPVLPFQPVSRVFPPPPPPVATRAPTPEEPQRASRIGPWTPPGSAPRPAEAPFMSALAASNAAAGGAAPAPSPSNGSAAVSARRRGGEILEMLWCDASFLPRIRARPAWKKLLAGAKHPDEEATARAHSKEAKELRDAFVVLARVEPVDAAGLEAALDAATADGMFSPPLVLVVGDVALSFDEREVLKATLGLVAPFAAGDKKLKEQCDTTRELLESPWVETGSAGMAALTVSLREAFAKAQRGISPASLETQCERILLEQRRLQKRILLGETWVRALLVPDGSDHAIPLYLPEPAAKQLPMFTRFRARVLAELRLQLDQDETCDSALRAVALGRLVTHPRRG